MKFDHLGVVVSDLRIGRQALGGSLGISRWTQEYEDPHQDVYVQFGCCHSGLCYELVAPRSRASPVARAATARINVIHHVAYLVDNLSLERAKLFCQGMVQLGEPNPAIAFDYCLIQFFASPIRFVLELIEAPDHRHEFLSHTSSPT
jgi:methylmalonyl-CoA/ethylmalonyl-CoA epimerase